MPSESSKKKWNCRADRGAESITLSWSDESNSSHERNQPAAAGHFELTKDRVEMLFHHRQTQAGVIRDLLVTPSFADKSRNFLFAPGKSEKMGQTRARRPVRPSSAMQIFALDQKMRQRHTG
jgi:hypothetical protein